MNQAIKEKSFKKSSIVLIGLFIFAMFNFISLLRLTTPVYHNLDSYHNFSSILDPDLSPDQRYRMIILFHQQQDLNQLLKLNTMDIIVLKQYRLIPALLILATPIQARQLMNLEGVAGIWLDKRINYLPNPQVDLINVPGSDGNILNADDVNFDLTKIHEKYNGSNIIVAILDTGIDPTHPDLDDLDDNETTNESKIINGVSFVEMEPFYLGDFHGHGTYVAGIIAGTGNASNGGIKGVAPGALLMNIKVLASNGEGYQSWIISGIEYAVTHGADIIAMCFSGPGLPNDPLSQAIDAATKQGVVVITATGDDGPSYSSIGAPGMAASAITVGAYNQITGIVAQNSSRGPIFDLRTGPDLIAPGVNITSCRVNSKDNPFEYQIPEFGTPINESYTRASGSFAAAAYVTGACALFLQAFKLLDPINLKLALQKNAYDIGANPNAQGLGVIDINSTFYYLNQTYGEDPIGIDRTYTPSLPYLGFIGTDNLTILDFLFNRKIGINCSIGSYADFGVLTFYNKTSDFNTSHFLLGRFGIKYNNQDLKWFSDMHVLREMHYVFRGFYDRALSILTDEKLIYTILIESWDFINTTDVNNPIQNVSGFKISITLNNLLNTPVSNISIFNWWKMDLFFNETNYAKDDWGAYNDSDDIIYANDTYETTHNRTYIGFKATIPTNACEVDTNSTTYDDIIDDNLKSPNFQSFSNGDIGLASKWILGTLNPNESRTFSGALGIGNSYSDLRNQIEWILHNTTTYNVTDIVICDFNTSIGRMVEIKNSIYTDILIINVGTLTIENITTKFTLNSSNYDFSQTFTNQTLQPYQICHYSASALPTTKGVYNISWYAINTTYEDIPQEITEEEAFKRDTQPLDNVIMRNLFIYEKPKLDLDNGTLIFPNNLTFDPLIVQMPGDSIKYNISILSNVNIDNISLQVDGNASDMITLTPNFIENPASYSFIDVEINIPILQEPGFYNATVTLVINASFSKFIRIQFTVINYTQIKGRVLFDTSHSSIKSLQEWNERLDSIYANYFEFYKLASENFYNLDELPYGSTITSDILSYYDAVIICDPEQGYNATEITAYQDYVNSGGSLFVWAENPDECNISSLNAILNIYGLNVTENTSEGYFYENLSTMNHKITQNITVLELIDSVNISITGKAQLLSNHIALINSSDDTNSKILLVGDSDLFTNAHLTSQNNSQFVLTSFQWLMSNTIKIQVEIYSNYSSDIIYLGDKVHISINVLVPNGSKPVSSKAILAAAIIFPNKTIYYNYFSFYLRDGWHTMFFLTDIANQTGWYNLILFVKHVSGVSLYNTSIPAFYVNASAAPQPPSVELEPPPEPIFPPLVGFVFIWGILSIFLVIWVYNIVKLNRKIKTIS